MNRIVAVDLETTGLDPYSGAKIIEIGGIGIHNLKVVEEDSFHRLVNPGIPIPQEITLLNGITDEMVKNADSIEMILPQFLRFLGNSPILAHNAEFDVKFLNYYSEKIGLGRINNRVFDTMVLSKEIFPNEKSHSLDKLLERLEINFHAQKRHRSIEDAILTAKAFIKLIELL